MSSDHTSPRTARTRDTTDPTLRFRIAGERATVVGADEQFRRRFGDPGGRRLSAVLSEILQTPAPESFTRRVAAGEADDRYAVTPDGDGDGPDLLVRPAYDGPENGRLRFVGLPSPPSGDTTVTSPADGSTTELDGETVASVVSHDLRNPLDVAKANLRVARETGETERLAAVADAHDRMAEIIEDVLTLARADDLQGEPVDLVAVARTAWDRVATDDACLRVTPSSLPADGDPDTLARLFENLFRNAVEHAGPAPTVRLRQTPTGFAVTDDGPGVSPAARDRVFDSGYSTADNTGLGLAIVARIVAAHGWEIDVTESAAGGARFEVTRSVAPEAPTET